MARSPDDGLWITRKRFETIVAESLDGIPKAFRDHLENVAVVVEDEPDEETLRDLGLDPDVDTLYGLYQGTPINERADLHVGLPDRVVVYYLPLAEDFTDEYHLRREIRKTVVHEIGHFFGFSDERMQEMGY